MIAGVIHTDGQSNGVEQQYSGGRNVGTVYTTSRSCLYSWSWGWSRPHQEQVCLTSLLLLFLCDRHAPDDGGCVRCVRIAKLLFVTYSESMYEHPVCFNRLFQKNLAPNTFPYVWITNNSTDAQYLLHCSLGLADIKL